jgi:pSer/pThr/pTyr-binding forkhead associated (FHA) protein
LRIITTGKIISLLGREHYTLGRSGHKQAIIPDVDLSEYEAYEAGVSRIHAEIQLREDGIYIVDLDSANKTLVNGKELEPQSPYPIRHGDLLQLGGLRLQLISRYRM